MSELRKYLDEDSQLTDITPIVNVGARKAPHKHNGVYKECTSSHTDYIIEIPEGASSVLLWFTFSDGDPTMEVGRVAFGDNSPIEPLTGKDRLMGYHPAFPVEYAIPEGDTHLHVASLTSGNVVRGFFTTPD